jgi:hypothetical protein
MTIDEVSARRRRRVVRRENAGGGTPPLDLDPHSAYELLTRQMVQTLSEELREIRLRVNGLIFVTLGAVLTEIVLRLVR